MADDFKYVKSKSRKKNRQDELIKNPEIYANDLFNKVEKCKKSLRDDDFRLYASKAIYNLKELTKTNFNFNRIKIVCYGLGSFDDSLAARYQFALLLLIIDAFKLENQIEHVELFDPLFSDADIRVIKNHYGLDVISSNERAMKTCDANLTTLFFMPHCPKALYNNLLYANWSNDRLNRLIIFGNSFSHLDSIGIDPNLYSYLKDSLYLLDEIKLEDECECTNAFAELSFNIFKIKNTPELDCMKNKLKPVYDSCCLNAPIYTDNEEVI